MFKTPSATGILVVQSHEAPCSLSFMILAGGPTSRVRCRCIFQIVYYINYILLQQSLDDVGAELTQMRTELQKLMEVIQTKDQAIEDLEAQLKVPKDKVTAK